MKDTVTKIILKVIDILFLYNVLGTSYGCLLGLLLLSFQDLIASYIPEIGLIKWYGFVVFGILACNIPPMFKKKYTDPKIETKLKYTREMIKEGKFNATEKKSIWRNLIKSAFEDMENTTNIKYNDNSSNETSE